MHTYEYYNIIVDRFFVPIFMSLLSVEYPKTYPNIYIYIYRIGIYKLNSLFYSLKRLKNSPFVQNPIFSLDLNYTEGVF